MKYLIVILFLFIATSVFGADVIKYDPADPVVSNRVVWYEKSVNTQKYITDPNNINSTIPNHLINPNVELLVQESKFWKVDNGTVIDMSQFEIDSILLSEQQAQEQEEISDIERLDVTVEEVIIALVKRINIRIPSNKITKQEVIDQIKKDKGL